MVNCRFIGGARGEEIHSLPATACQDLVGLMSDTWIAQGRDGDNAVMKGRRSPSAPWISFTKEIYEKVKPGEPSNVTYQYVRTEQVNRCEKILANKGRRCGNEAETHSQFCRVHQPTS